MIDARSYMLYVCDVNNNLYNVYSAYSRTFEQVKLFKKNVHKLFVNQTTYVIFALVMQLIYLVRMSIAS
jgi:hypothetical protein